MTRRRTGTPWTVGQIELPGFDEDRWELYDTPPTGPRRVTLAEQAPPGRARLRSGRPRQASGTSHVGFRCVADAWAWGRAGAGRALGAVLRAHFLTTRAPRPRATGPDTDEGAVAGPPEHRDACARLATRLADA